jgi:hypothetical protein
MNGIPQGVMDGGETNAHEWAVYCLRVRTHWLIDSNKQAYRDIRDAQCALFIHKDMKERLIQFLLYLIWFIV